MESKNTPQAIQYFWRILDVRHKGGIDTFTVNMFLREIVKKLEEKNKIGYKIDDIKDELWDMAKPKREECITLHDLLQSGQADTIIACLIDAKAFFAYDQRESAAVDLFDEF